MRKYMEVIRISFKMRIAWRFDVAMTMLATTARIASAWVLWPAIFKENASVGGITIEVMLSYYVLTAIISSIDFSNKISGEVSWLIKDGGFSKHMVTPMNPMGFFCSMTGGETVYHLGFSFLAAVICSCIFQVKIVLTGEILKIMLGVLMVPIGFTFMAAYHYIIGMMAFKFQDVGFFLHIQDAIIAFATGTIIPLSLLPVAAVNVLKFLPFSHVVYTPTMLLTGEISLSDGLFGLLTALCWTIAALIAAQAIYKRLRIKHDGVGI